MDHIDTIVVGGGVVGLAVARSQAATGASVILVEKERHFGMGTSSRNSEVIHAGIYYPQNSLKARACVRGKELLYRYLEERGLPFKNCGKIIVACNSDQGEDLLRIKQKAENNGVFDLTFLSRAQILDLEPNVEATIGLCSPSSGILDSHAFMQSLLGDFEDHGGIFSPNTSFVSAETKSGFVVAFETSDNERYSLHCDRLINCAGLFSQAVAAGVSGLDVGYIPRGYMARGNYFTLARKSPFTRLVYPVPEAGGLGVHVTLDLGGQCRFGPDVEWISEIGYDVDPRRGEAFYAAIRKYFPGLRDGELVSAYSGIRPKLKGPGEGDADFVVSGPSEHSVPGLYNFFGIESPGLTSSLALAEELAERVKREW